VNGETAFTPVGSYEADASATEGGGLSGLTDARLCRGLVRGVNAKDNISISCGPSPKAEKQGLEPRSQISRTPARPPARLLNASVMVANPARLAERRQNYSAAQ
jgi:hypothetical protein